jgi:predicted aspartyl protease
MKFPYLKYGSFYRPVVPVTLVHDSQRFTTRTLLDTGADISIVRSEIGEQIGLEVTSGIKYTIAGVGGTTIGYYHMLDLVLGGTTFSNIPVIFAEGIAEEGYSILGIKDYLITFGLYLNTAKRSLK